MPHDQHPPLLRIQIDHRERDEHLLAALQARRDLAIEIKPLPLGDYLVEGSVLFERKSAADFARSLFNGRLFSQASRLTQAPQRAAFLLQGNTSDWRETGVSRECLQGALITLMLVFDLPVLRASDSDEAARLLVYAGSQLIRARTGGNTSYRIAKAKRKATRQRRVLQALPGVGRTRANALLARFGSVANCANASVEELLEVEGIGLATAQAIHETVSEATLPYAKTAPPPPPQP